MKLKIHELREKGTGKGICRILANEVSRVDANTILLNGNPLRFKKEFIVRVVYMEYADWIRHDPMNDPEFPEEISAIDKSAQTPLDFSAEGRSHGEASQSGGAGKRSEKEIGKNRSPKTNRR